ncbi:hypothetical protein DFA_05260 [Cavenderia fasciculata]|uniref:Uncharacterized protein n=1 Tax=Cavenderia fasciculata TaxID=261658 RepID=F4PNS7_CACFS|nr:uncharacterized protein DFA_05260 [Cavenderia fasciculata]EGG23130.1 hypothetical protein DFA_05260 [Cavenderia fasciculata]|eukprot:XP_004360981.1 hypothetical protein DFA_05260 [Cavenderia fasciculata]
MALVWTLLMAWTRSSRKIFLAFLTSGSPLNQSNFILYIYILPKIKIKFTSLKSYFSNQIKSNLTIIMDISHIENDLIQIIARVANTHVDDVNVPLMAYGLGEGWCSEISNEVERKYGISNHINNHSTIRVLAYSVQSNRTK